MRTLSLAFLLSTAAVSSAGEQAIPVTIAERVPAVAIPVALYGQFLERATFGEPGPEACLLADRNELRPEVLARIQDLRPPMIRFPWGTDGDYSDWTELVDGVPGRGPRPATMKGLDGKTIGTRFGYAEFFRLCRQVGSEPLLMVNLLDGLARRRPLADAARHAAGLVAYANARSGQALPAGMTDWPAIRVANGNAEPARARFVQLGNEWWMGGFVKEVRAAMGGSPSPEELVRWYAEVVAAYVAAIHAVDPSIGIIIDLDLGLDPDGRAEAILLADPRIRREVKWVALHAYAPGNMARKPRRSGVEIDPATLTADQWWYLWTGMPGRYGDDGQSRAILPDGHRGDLLRLAEGLGYRLACTEWNWNGWSQPHGQPNEWAAALGAAGFLNGLVRHADRVEVGIQSMLVGVSWNLAAIRVADGGRGAVRLNPRAAVTAFLARHRGERLLALRHPPLPTVEQPFTQGWSDSIPRLALLDLVATASAGAVHLQAINRHPREALVLTVDFGSRPPGTTTAAQESVVQGGSETDPEARLVSTTIQAEAGTWRIVLPPASVSVVTWASEEEQRYDP